MSQAEDCISTPVGYAVLQRRTLLRRLQEVDLRPDAAWARLDRVQTHTRSADDRARWAHRAECAVGQRWPVWGQGTL